APRYHVAPSSTSPAAPCASIVSWARKAAMLSLSKSLCPSAHASRANTVFGPSRPSRALSTVRRSRHGGHDCTGQDHTKPEPAARDVPARAHRAAGGIDPEARADPAHHPTADQTRQVHL